MGGPLDFIVFGTPRSGTTALGRYLSATPEVYCFIEILTAFANHEGLNAPDSFLRFQGHWARKQHVPGAASPMHREIARRREAIRFYGHKRPNYYLNLQRIVNQSGCSKAFLCYRDIRSVADSYSSRAQDPEDHWDRGRVGIVAALDAIFMAHAAAHVKGLDILVVPQSALARDWQTTVGTSLSFLAPDIEPRFDRKAVESIEGMKERARTRPAPSHAQADLELVKRVEEAGLDACLNRETPFALCDCREELRTVSERLPRNLMTFAARAAAGHPDEDVRNFAERWRRMVRPGWRRLKAELNAAQPPAS